jgi:phage head maturation protease
MNRLKHRTFPFSMKTGDVSPEGGATIAGTAACFLNIDGWGEMFVPGCFAAQLDFFKTEGVIRDEHCVTTGKVTDAAEVKEGLYFEGDILPTAAGRDQAILVRGKAITRLSVGACNYGHWAGDVEEVKTLWTEHGYTPTEDDLIRLGYGVFLITRSKPHEVSTTWLPANDQTQITSVKNGGPPAGTPFDDMATAALDAVEQLAARAEAIAKLRAADGRGLSAKARARIDGILSRLSALAKTPASEPDAPQPVPPELVPTNLYAEFLRITSRV